MRTERGIADGWLSLLALVGIAVGLWFAYNTVDHRGYVRGKAEVQAKFDKFVTDTAKAGADAESAARAKEAADKSKQERANAERTRLKRDLGVALKQLRDNRKGAGAGVVPSPPPGSQRPDLACFDRAEYQRAYGELVTEVRGLADESSENTIDLDTARRWIQAPQ